MDNSLLDNVGGMLDNTDVGLGIESGGLERWWRTRLEGVESGEVENSRISTWGIEKCDTLWKVEECHGNRANM